MAHTMPDLRKAAILVASVDRDTARTLLAKLLPEQIEQLEFAISRLGPIDDQEREAVLSEFARTAPAAPSNRPGNPGTSPGIGRPSSKAGQSGSHSMHASADLGVGNAATDHGRAHDDHRSAHVDRHHVDASHAGNGDVELALSAAAEASRPERPASGRMASQASRRALTQERATPSAAHHGTARSGTQPSRPEAEVAHAQPAVADAQQRASRSPATIQADAPQSPPSPIASADRAHHAAPSAAAPQPNPDDRAAFSFLQHAEQSELVALLANEHPQTTTVVLSHMPPERAARVLAELPQSQQADIVRRLVHLEETHPDVLRELEAGLARHLRRGSGGRPLSGSRGTRAVIDMLRAGGRRIERRILENVRRHDAELAQRIARPKPQLRFHDLLRFPPHDRAAWAREADGDLLALALLGCSADEAESLLAVLPPGMADSVRQKIARPGPIRLEDIDLAQRTLTQRVQRAIDDGRLEPNTEEPHLNMAG